MSAPIAEPTPKRRKLEDQAPARGTQQNSNARESEAANKHGSRPKARRRLDVIQEDTKAEIKVDGEEDSVVAIKKTAKARDVPNPRRQQPAPVNSPPTVAEDKTTSRRPRRQAAARAMDQVLQGFVEEAQSVDKLRRGQDTVAPSKRKRTRKTTEVTETKSLEEAGAGCSSGETNLAPTEASAPISNLKEQAIEPAEQGKKRFKGRRTKLKIVSEEEVANDSPNPGSIAARLPLAETTANPIMRSQSPKKQSKCSEDLIEPVQQRSSCRVQSPRKALDESKNTARRKHKPSKFIVSKDPSAAKLEPEVVGVGTAVESEDVPDLSGSRLKSARKHHVAPGQGEERATYGTAAVESKKKPTTVKPSECPRAVIDQNPSVSTVAQSALLGRSGRAKTQGSKRAQGPGEKCKERPTSTITASVAQPSNVDTDVDWLLTDKHTSKRTLAKRQARDTIRRPLEDEELPDVDLDDLLSTMATYVPRNLAPTARVTGRCK